MSNHRHHSGTMHLPPETVARLSGEILRRRWDDRCNGLVRKNVPSYLYRVINIAPELTPDEPLPEAFRAPVALEPDYYLDPVTTQPIVFNGFVWSYRGNGSDQNVQHFICGNDLFGGPPLRIDTGVVNMHVAGGIIACHFFAGHCYAVGQKDNDDRATFRRGRTGIS